MENIVFEESGIVTLDTAKKLKDAGFKYPTYHYYLDKDINYVKKGLYRVKHNFRRLNHNRYDEFIYSAPTKDELKNFKL